MTVDVNCCAALGSGTEDEICCYPGNTAGVDIHSSSFCLENKRKNKRSSVFVKVVVEYFKMQEKKKLQTDLN